MNRIRLFTASLLVVFSFLCSFAIAQEDRIFPSKGGAAVRGKIVERTRDKVVIEVKGANQSFASNEIARIINDGEPQQLSRAKDMIAQGNLDQAIEEFKKISEGDLKTDVVKKDSAFVKAYLAASNALRSKGDAAAAKNLLLAWAKENSTSNNFYAASEKLGELEMMSGSPEQAARYFGVLAGSPFSDFKVKGGYMSGKALLALKKPAEAKPKLEAVVQAQVSDSASLKYKKLANIALVSCLALEGKQQESLQALEKMIDEGDAADAELFAELYNAMGSILNSAGRSEEAVLAYLKTDLLYSSETDAHSEALYWLSQLWNKIGENQRAVDAKSRLAKLYPTSPWLKK